MTTRVSVIDPLADARWEELVERHPRASVFHTRGWLEALKRTYGYKPFALTTTDQGPLENGLPVCRVRTWATRRRLVSLPFSDHCDPLVDAPDDLSAMVGFLAGGMGKWRRMPIELRPLRGAPPGLSAGNSYLLHTLDLARPIEQIFDGFHHSGTQRGIRRAERDGVEYERGSSDRLLRAFYALLRMTRRRHALPPQPFSWFRNLVACLGDRVAIHLASHKGKPIASILTVSFRKTMVYKYGGSDAAYHRLYGMPFLFWRAIQGARSEGAEHLDLGRTDLDQTGLVVFKEHLGAARSKLTYYTLPPRKAAKARKGPFTRAARRVLPHLPDVALDLTGRLIYRHLG